LQGAHSFAASESCGDQFPLREQAAVLIMLACAAEGVGSGEDGCSGIS
jgi:hypothetical protein